MEQTVMYMCSFVIGLCSLSCPLLYSLKRSGCPTEHHIDPLHERNCANQPGGVKNGLHISGLGARESLKMWEINPMKLQGLGVSKFHQCPLVMGTWGILSEVKDTLLHFAPLITRKKRTTSVRPFLAVEAVYLSLGNTSLTHILDYGKTDSFEWNSQQ